MSNPSTVFRSNHRALVLVGRNNPEIPGRSPFTPFGSGFCVEPHGVIVTCWHTLEDFFRTWTVVEFNGQQQSCEPHEIPSFSFFAQLGPPGEIQLFPPRALHAVPDRDVAIIQLQGNHNYGPLPTLQLATTAPAIGDMVELVAHFQPGAPPKDPDGLSLGWAVTFQKSMVVALSSDSFFIDYQIASGMSGAPVCDRQTGEALGMISEIWSKRVAERELGVDTPVTRVITASTLRECHGSAVA